MQFHAETQRLYNHYYPIEIDQSLTFEQKVPEMISWWKQAHNAIIGQGITKEGMLSWVYVPEISFASY